jgi:hypothetical protein
MIVDIVFKDPEAMANACEDLRNRLTDETASEEEIEEKIEELNEVADRWVDVEYITLRIDTEKKTCEILKSPTALEL